MESSGDKFIDHKESVISVPRPRQLSALKVDITPPEDVHSLKNIQAANGSALSECQLSVSKIEGKVSFENNQSESTSEKSVVIQESLSSKESSSTKTVKKYATTIYTQRISGRKPRSSDSGSDVLSPTTTVAMNASLSGNTTPVEAGSPREICSVQFNVAGGMTSSTTTAFSKMFTKTVEATEVSTKERHLSECRFSIGGPADKLLSQETGLNHNAVDSSVDKEDITHETENQEKENDDSAFSFTEALISVRSEEEKEVAEYSPGLAIRTLTLEDLQEKRLTPDRETELNNNPALKSTDMSTTTLNSESTAVCQEKGFFSSYAEAAGNSLSMPENVSQEGVLFSEHNTSQMLASETSTSVTMTKQLSSLTSGGQILMQCTEESAASHRKPLFNPIEVERKFTMAENTEERLRALGARLHKEKTFTDIYYDNEVFNLITTDCWLRRRNDSWEAKVPLKIQDAGAIFSPASQFQEVRNEREISTWLVDQMGLEQWMRGDPIDLLVQAAGLMEFAKLTTTRRTYTLPSCMVDLDLTDNGVQVGEIDVMAASPEELPQALQTISSVAEQLGLSPLTLV
ncbi:uncharacterized protein LOC143285776 isoform X2 [Babylonia areolata]|uniref:uncharacterized protein LOC143285776 isoform X2 n=1 Tax=Babylonia areolata TaxID=304850 RepID=UPI003FD677A7